MRVSYFSLNIGYAMYVFRDHKTPVKKLTSADNALGCFGNETYYKCKFLNSCVTSEDPNQSLESMVCSVQRKIMTLWVSSYK